MDCKKYWEVFIATGKVEDYLRFADNRKINDNDQNKEEEIRNDNAADNSDGYCDFGNANR